MNYTIYNVIIVEFQGPYGPKILASAVGLVLLASLAKDGSGAQTDGQTWRFMYIDEILLFCTGLYYSTLR